MMNLKSVVCIRPEIMRKEDVENCRWIGYGIIKGVTSPKNNLTIYGIPEEPCSGLHGELISGQPDVDPTPLCYEENHDKGFGDFVRWVIFADPKERQHFFGIDFSLTLRPTSGVATSFRKVWEIVGTLIDQGISPWIEVVLLNCRMIEPEYLTQVRKDAGLITAFDWVVKGERYFSQRSNFCPKCGQKTFEKNSHKYCCLCGAGPELFYI